MVNISCSEQRTKDFVKRRELVKRQSGSSEIPRHVTRIKEKEQLADDLIVSEKELLKSNLKPPSGYMFQDFKENVESIRNSFNDLFRWRRLKIRNDVFVYMLPNKQTRPKSVPGVPWTMMHIEVYRLSTFATYPQVAVKSPVMLAKEGFVYAGNGDDDKVVCFYCGVEKKNWTSEDVIEEVHRKLSPQCPKVAANVQNISVPVSNTAILGLENESIARSVSAGEDQVDALLTTSVPANTNLNNTGMSIGATPSIMNIANVDDIPRQISNLQLDQHETRDASMVQVQSTLSEMTISTLPIMSSNGNETATNSRSDSNNTSSLTQNTSEIVSSSTTGRNPTYQELGITTDRPKHPELAVKLKRVATFTLWPRFHHHTPEELAEAGFYYAGNGDCTRCFYCGGGLRNWEDEDDVWVEHARWFPRCSYLRQKMGVDFVDIVQDLHLKDELISIADVRQRLEHQTNFLITQTRESPLKKDPAVISVIGLGFSEDDVLQAAEALKQEEIPVSSEALITKLEEEEKHKVRTSRWTISYETEVTEIDLEQIRSLKERNNTIRQQIVCKICLDQDVSVVFLPCGHLVSCEDCASAMKDCPVCRTNVKGIARALMA